MKIIPKAPMRLLAIGALAAPAILTAAPNAHATATPAPAGQLRECGDRGTSNKVRMYTYCNGNGYQVWAEFLVDVQEGHIDVWGPNLSRRSSPNGYWAAGQDTSRWYARGTGKVCVEGWSRSGGKWHSIGLPCVTV